MAPCIMSMDHIHTLRVFQCLEQSSRPRFNTGFRYRLEQRAALSSQDNILVTAFPQCVHQQQNLVLPSAHLASSINMEDLQPESFRGAQAFRPGCMYRTLEYFRKL